MADFTYVADLFKDLGSRLANVGPNIYNSFADTTLRNWIRIIAILGGYLLVRPYLVKGSVKKQEQEYAKIYADADAPKAKMPPNQLRDYQGRAVELDDSESEAGEGAEPQWGKKARQRKRKMVKQLEAELEQRSREEDRAESILDKFVDYEEGKDGW